MTFYARSKSHGTGTRTGTGTEKSTMQHGRLVTSSPGTHHPNRDSQAKLVQYDAHRIHVCVDLVQAYNLLGLLRCPIEGLNWNGRQDTAKIYI